MSLEPKPGIETIAAYVPGRSSVVGVADPIKLSSNESALGASPKAVEAFTAAASQISRYPDGSMQMLRDAIASHFGLDARRIVCGNGSDEILTLLANAYVSPGDEVIYSEHAFHIYGIATLANSGKRVVVPETNLTNDVDKMLAAVTSKTRLVYLANPSNPTGTYLSQSEMRRLHAGLRKDIILVIDAAYAEFVRRNDYESGIEMVANFDNVVMTRTFSKIYGLAALRVGWSYCPAPIAEVLNKVRAPFNVSIPAQAAAIAALSDRAHIAKAIEHNETWRNWLAEQVNALGLRTDAGVGNFVLIHFAGEKQAKEADDFLCAKGLILRGVGSYHLPQCLRLTVGTEDANRKVVAALKEFTGHK